MPKKIRTAIYGGMTLGVLGWILVPGAVGFLLGGAVGFALGCADQRLREA